MCTYAKLEVDHNGTLYQSSRTVPVSGRLPRPQNTADHPDKTRLYTERMAAPTAIVALTGSPEDLRIQAIYFPPPLRGLQFYRLLGPFLMFALVVVGIGSLVSISSPLPLAIHIIISALMIAVAYATLLLPLMTWFRTIYTQGAPTSLEQKRVSMRHPDIKIYRDIESFLVDTHPGV